MVTIDVLLNETALGRITVSEQGAAFLDVAVAGDMGLPWTLPRIVGAGRARVEEVVETVPILVREQLHGRARRGFEVDAKCARNPAEGLSILRQRRRRGTLPEIVVMALGTNIATSGRDIAHMLRAVGRRRTLMLVTPFREWHPFNTRPMRRAAGRYPKRVKLIDWSRRAHRKGRNNTLESTPGDVGSPYAIGSANLCPSAIAQLRKSTIFLPLTASLSVGRTRR